MDRYNHLQYTPQTAYSHVRNTNNMRFQLPNAPLGSTGKPYRVAVRIIREKKGHDEDAQVEEGGNAALNSVGTSASETLINQVPPNFCSIWHPQSADERVQLGEMVGAAMMQGCGVYVVDCGYEEASLGLNDDMLSHYVRHSAMVPNPTFRSLVGRGGLGGLGPSFGIEEKLSSSGAASNSAANTNGFGATSAFSLRPQKEGVAVAFVSKLLSEGPGETIQFSFFAMSAIDRPVTDLLLPLLSVADAATVAATLDERATGTLSTIGITSVKQFNETISTVTSSNSFRMARPRLSFGFIFMFKRIPHVFLLLDQHHQRDAIAAIEGQFATLPAFIQVKLREADAANNRLNSNGNRNNADNTGYLTNGPAAVLDPYGGQASSADFYGSNANLQHYMSSAAITTSDGSVSLAGVTNNTAGSNAARDSSDGLPTNLSAMETFMRLNGGLDFKAAQARRLMAANVLAHIRRSMALHFVKQQRVEFFKPMYVVRLGGDQKGRDPLGMLPFLLARGAPNPSIGPNGMDARVLMNPIGLRQQGIGFGDASPWNAGDLGALDARQRQLHSSLEAQEQLAYQQQILDQQHQLQQAAAKAGLNNSILMYRPAVTLPHHAMMGQVNATVAYGGNQLSPQRALFPNAGTPAEPMMMMAPNTSAYHPGGLQSSQRTFTSTGYSSPTAASPRDVSHLSRMGQSPTQIPYALLQNPANHPNGIPDKNAGKPQFETIEVDANEGMASAMFRSNIGAGEDGPTTTSTAAPPAVKPFLVTDATISDTVAYLDKEKHVCRNAHRELQKDIHDVFKRIEELTHRHKLVREALKRKIVEGQRLQKDVEGSNQRTTQIEKVLADLEAEVQRTEEILSFDDKNKHTKAACDAQRERERIEKKSAHTERMAALAEEHRGRMFQEGAEAKKQQEDLQRQIEVEQRRAEMDLVRQRRDVLTVNAELNALSEAIAAKGNAILQSQEKVAESAYRKNQLEAALHQLRDLKAEWDRSQSALATCAFERQEASLKVAALEKGLAAYDQIMAAEATAISKEVNATLDKTEGAAAGRPPLSRSPAPAALPLGATTFRLSNPPTPNASHISRTASYSRVEAQDETTIFKARQAEAEASVISSRISSLSELRRTAASLKSLVAKQARTMALRRAKANRFKCLVTVEESETSARAAVVAAWQEGLGSIIAPQLPESHRKSHRLFEMMLVDGLASAHADTYYTNSRSQPIPFSGAGILSSALKHSNNSNGSPQKRIRFVDADIDLNTTTSRLSSLKLEVQRKVRERFDLVGMLESLRSESHALASDSEALDLEAQMRAEIEGVARLRAAHHEVFERHEEELQRRRKVYMAMFLEFLPQVKKELMGYAAEERAEGKRRTRGRDAAAIIASAVAETERKEAPSAAEANTTHKTPRYMTATAASKSKKKDPTVPAQPSSTLGSNDGRIDATYAETVYSYAGAERRLSAELDAASDGSFTVVNSLTDEASQLASASAAPNSNRYASIALKHIHGQHARGTLNPAALSGQANIVVDRGDALCQLYWDWREGMVAADDLKRKVEEDEDETTKLEHAVNKLGERMAEMRDRLGTLASERRAYAQDRDQWLKGLSEASAEFSSSDISQGTTAHKEGRAHHDRAGELTRKLEGLAALGASVATEIALGEKDNRLLAEEIESLAKEVAPLPALEERKARLRTEIALIESQVILNREQEADAERRHLSEEGRKRRASTVMMRHNYPDTKEGDSSSTLPSNLGSQQYGLSQGNTLSGPKMPLPALSPERRRMYAQSFQASEAVPTVAEAAAMGALISTAVSNARDDDETAAERSIYSSMRTHAPVPAPNDSSKHSLGIERLRAAHSALPKSVQDRIARHNEKRRAMNGSDAATMSDAATNDDARSSAGSVSSSLANNNTFFDPNPSRQRRDLMMQRPHADEDHHSSSPLSNLLRRLERSEAKVGESTRTTNSFLAHHSVSLPAQPIQHNPDSSRFSASPIQINTSSPDRSYTAPSHSASKYAALREVLASHIEAISRE